MQEAFLEILACPVCLSGELRLTVHARDHREIREGELICQSCGTRLLIEKGLVQALIDPHPKVTAEARGWVELLDVPEKQHEFRDDWILALPFVRPDQTPEQESVRIWHQAGRHFFKRLDRLDVRGKRVLELGAGRCWGLAELTRRGAYAVGLDILAHKYLGLETADVWFAAHPEMYFERVVGDMHRLPFQPATFNYVVTTASLHHTDALPAALKEIARVLGMEGRALFVNEPVVLRAQARPDLSQTSEVLHGIVESRPTYGEWLQAFKFAGLCIEEVQFDEGMHIILKKGDAHWGWRRLYPLRLAEPWIGMALSNFRRWLAERIRRATPAPGYYARKLIGLVRRRPVDRVTARAEENNLTSTHRTFTDAVFDGQTVAAAQAFSRDSAEYRRQYWNRLARVDHQLAITGKSGATKEEFLTTGRDILKWLREYDLCDDRSVVLDIGCGAGRVAYHVAPVVKFLYGIDVSDEMVERARRNLAHLSNVEIRLTSGESLDGFADQSIDLVYSILVLQHMERTNCYRLFSEIARVLRPGGKVLVQLPWSGSRFYASAYDQEPRDHDLWYARMYLEEELQDLFSQNGIEVIAIRVVDDNLWGAGMRRLRDLTNSGRSEPPGRPAAWPNGE